MRAGIALTQARNESRHCYLLNETSNRHAISSKIKRIASSDLWAKFDSFSSLYSIVGSPNSLKSISTTVAPKIASLEPLPASPKKFLTIIL